MPELDGSGGDQCPQKKCLKHSCRLGYEQNAAPGPAISKDAGEDREEQYWQGLQRTHHAELPGAVCQLKHQPGLPDALHPGAGQRDDLPEPVEAKIALT